MSNLFYNVGSQSLDNGLNDIEIPSGLDYFIVLDAPSNANIKVRLGSNTAPQIPLKDGWQIETINVNKIYLSCDVVAGGRITYGQADGNIKIQPNPTINAVDTVTEIGGFSASLINALGKELNPYDDENPTILIGSSTATTTTTLLDITLDCDKINIEIVGATNFLNGNGLVQRGHIRVDLDGVTIGMDGGYSSTYKSISTAKKIMKKGVRGRNLTIRCLNFDNTYRSHYHVEKINLKA